MICKYHLKAILASLSVLLMSTQPTLAKTNYLSEGVGLCDTQGSMLFAMHAASLGDIDSILMLREKGYCAELKEDMPYTLITKEDRVSLVLIKEFYVYTMTINLK